MLLSDPVTMLPDLVNPGTPAEAEWANDVIAALSALTAQLNAITPIGTMLPYGGDSAPGGGFWLLARGDSVSKTTYSALYAVYADKFGLGRPAPPAGNFWLPDMRGQVPTGVSPGGAYADIVGRTFGSTDAVAVVHAHTTPPHNHTLGGHTHVGTTSNQVGTHYHLGGDGGASLLAGTNQGNGIYATFLPQETIAALYFAGTDANHGDHVHTFSTSGPSTDSSSAAPSTDNAGVSGSLRNLPPGVAVNYIIRAI